ncbi:MAG: iron-containing alcohol dehydrogenase [Actinomycetota bacterium]|nr:iron-containing alcohol dehydrogenase [Actinomycetota bacterium]
MTTWVHEAGPQHVRFGTGTASRLRPIVRDAGARRVMLVTSKGRLESELVDRAQRSIGRMLASTFDQAEPHVPAPVVQDAVRRVRSDDIDTIVTIGGGSVIDLGKAIGFFLEQEAGTPGTTIDDRPALVHVAVPTTFTRAEATSYFGMTDPMGRQKHHATSPTALPRWVVLDPELGAEAPVELAVTSALAALAGAVEAALSSSRTPEADLLAHAAVGRLVGAVDRVASAPDDLDARVAMAEGALLSGRARQNAGLGAHFGLTQLLGGRTAMRHGLAAAALLAPVVRFDADAAGAQLAQLGALLGAEDVASVLEDLVRGLPIPHTLAESGIEDDDLLAVARMAPGHPAVQANVRPTGEADALALLRTAT